MLRAFFYVSMRNVSYFNNYVSHVRTRNVYDLLTTMHARNACARLCSIVKRCVMHYTANCKWQDSFHPKTDFTS
jgi:hypothetical protein